MTLAIIYAGYNQAEYIPQSLKPWIYLRETCKEIKIKIYAVSVAFKEYEGMGLTVDNSKELLKQYKQAGLIDGLVVKPDFITEASARNLALDQALNDGATDILIWDADEIPEVPEICRMVKFVQANEFIPWFRGSLKNYVFDKFTYLAEPFTPPRWFKVKCGDLSLSKFAYDNDIDFYRGVERISHNNLPSLTFPKSVQFTKHYTWLNNEKSRAKILYQSVRGWECSYRWDNDLGLCFNELYFEKRGLPIPTVLRDTPN